MEMRVFSVWRLPSGPRTARIESKRDARVVAREFGAVGVDRVETSAAAIS